MLLASHSTIRYDREERARQSLRGSTLALVGPRAETSDVAGPLTEASARVVHVASLDLLVEQLGRTDTDAVIVDASVLDRRSSQRVRSADPTLAAVVLGGSPRGATRLRGSLVGLERAPILDRPAARFEILELAAEAVDQTRRHRRGSARLPVLSPSPEPSAQDASSMRPVPDGWSCEQLRARICCWSDRVGLSDRETEVMRGVVRGLKNKEIASQLELSVHAVKKYLRELLYKLELESRHEVAWLLDRTPNARPSHRPLARDP